jgi:hypothetical protein
MGGVIMHWLFLLPLSTGVLSGYICQKAKDEIYYLTATIALISLLLSLIMAPWQLQLGILLVVLLVAGQFWQGRAANQTPVVTTEAETEQKYLYRGVSYSQEEARTEAPSEEITLKYRGVEVHTTPSQTAANPRAATPRKYRGVTIEPDA